MRIIFNSLSLPKKAAKRLKKTLQYDEIFLSLAKCQELASMMLGYGSWHELNQSTEKAKNKPSHTMLDEDCSFLEQSKRLDFQKKVLAEYLNMWIKGMDAKIHSARISAGNIASEKLSGSMYSRSRLYVYEDNNEGYFEWRFYPSLRARTKENEIDELLEGWESGNINYGNYRAALLVILKQQPENIYAMSEVLRASLNIERVEDTKKQLDEFERELDNTIPFIEYNRRKKQVMSWAALNNRYYIRAVSCFAECCYRVGRYKTAKTWFNFAIKISDQFTVYNNIFLKDLRSKSPHGNAHILAKTINDKQDMYQAKPIQLSIQK